MYWAEFFTIVIAHLLAVTSPGPDFAVVMRQSVRCGTRSGIWTSLGVGSAILLHVSYCLLGVAFLLSQSPALFNAMKLLAAVYLFHLGVQSIRASFVRPVIDGEATLEPALSAARAFGLGFVTNGLNPKATLFFLALFTAVIDPNTPTSIQVIYGLYLAGATFLWFAFLSLILGIPRVRVFILRMGAWLERAMGAILILISLKLALNGV
jgi:threonine/homoserine/homoserine lactone efflux protein